MPLNQAISDMPCDMSEHWTVDVVLKKTDVGHQLVVIEAQFSFLEKSGRVVDSFP